MEALSLLVLLVNGSNYKCMFQFCRAFPLHASIMVSVLISLVPMSVNVVQDGQVTTAKQVNGNLTCTELY